MSFGVRFGLEYFTKTKETSQNLVLDMISPSLLHPLSAKS